MATMSRALQGYGAKIADWGLPRALYASLMHFLAKRLGFRIHYVFIGANRPDLMATSCPQTPPGYAVRLAKKSDLQPFVCSSKHNLSSDFINNAFANQDECYVVLCNQELVSFSFTTRVAAPVTAQLEIVVPEGFRYAYKSWTDVEHRRNNLSKLRHWVKINSADTPFNERSLFYIETHNYASLLHGYRNPSNRAQRAGVVGWLTLFGREIPFASRTAKWVGFEFRRKDKDHRRQYI